MERGKSLFVLDVQKWSFTKKKVKIIHSSFAGLLHLWTPFSVSLCLSKEIIIIISSLFVTDYEENKNCMLHCLFCY